jgi:DNA-binding transcriptional LysR family regulator
LPPLSALAAFEAAARHLSFKNAAQELSVTPGAVSHQIKALESELGAPLFWRRHRGVELTPEGEGLFETLATSFARISQNLQAVRDRGAGDTVTIGSTSAVAALWLSPAVLRFWREQPEIRVNQVTQDRPFRNRPDLDLFIRYGRDPSSGLEQVELYQDELVPVGSPALAAQLQGADLDVLAAQRLIHLDSEDASWTTWTDWFRQLGYGSSISQGVRVNNYAVALQAAQDGAGLALGWRRLLSPVLDSRALVPIAPHSIKAPHRFYLISKPESELGAATRMMRDWIISGATPDIS